MRGKECLPSFYFLKGEKMKESAFQLKLIKEIESIIPGSIVLKGNSAFIQGFPDLVVLLPNGKWCCLECKKSEDAQHQPNQDYYIDFLNDGGYASFIFPNNKEDILNDIQRSLCD